MSNLDNIEYPRRGLKKQEKESLKRAYKGGVDTKIDHKHFYEFNKRFMEENVQAIKEAQEEQERLRKKRKAIYLNKLRRYGVIK